MKPKPPLGVIRPLRATIAAGSAARRSRFPLALSWRSLRHASRAARPTAMRPFTFAATVALSLHFHAAGAAPRRAFAGAGRRTVPRDRAAPRRRRREEAARTHCLSAAEARPRREESPPGLASAPLPGHGPTRSPLPAQSAQPVALRHRSRAAAAPVEPDMPGRPGPAVLLRPWAAPPTRATPAAAAADRPPVRPPSRRAPRRAGPRASIPGGMAPARGAPPGAATPAETLARARPSRDLAIRRIQAGRHPPVQLVWRDGGEGSAARPQPSPGASVPAPSASAPSASAPAAWTPQAPPQAAAPPQMDRLVDEVMRRLDRIGRVERARRGL
jgi:hypothetical protein